MALEPQLEGNSSSPVGDQLQNSVNKAERFTLLMPLTLTLTLTCSAVRTVCSVLGRISFSSRGRRCGIRSSAGAGVVDSGCLSLCMSWNANSGAWGHTRHTLEGGSWMHWVFCNGGDDLSVAWMQAAGTNFCDTCLATWKAGSSRQPQNGLLIT